MIIVGALFSAMVGMIGLYHNLKATPYRRYRALVWVVGILTNYVLTLLPGLWHCIGPLVCAILVSIAYDMTCKESLERLSNKGLAIQHTWRNTFAWIAITLAIYFIYVFSLFALKVLLHFVA